MSGTTENDRPKEVENSTENEELTYLEEAIKKEVKRFR